MVGPMGAPSTSGAHPYHTFEPLPRCHCREYAQQSISCRALFLVLWIAAVALGLLGWVLRPLHSSFVSFWMPIATLGPVAFAPYRLVPSVATTPVSSGLVRKGRVQNTAIGVANRARDEYLGVDGQGLWSSLDALNGGPLDAPKWNKGRPHLKKKLLTRKETG